MSSPRLNARLTALGADCSPAPSNAQACCPERLQRAGVACGRGATDPYLLRRPPPAAAAGHQPAPVLARLQELSKLTISTASSLESLTVTAKKAEAEPYLLQHLPAVLKATADKVRACLGA